MLSSVLKSERAIAVNIRIMRVYNKLRELLLNNQDLLLRMEQLEKNMEQRDIQISQVFAYLQQFINQKGKREPIGYRKD